MKTATFSILLAFFYLTANAQQTKRAINNHLVDYQAGTSTALPTTNSPDHTQNSVHNDQGVLELYAADGAVYDATGNLLVQQYDVTAPIQNAKGFSEFSFVPVPSGCGEYYAISTFSIGDIDIKNYLIYSRLKKVNGNWQAQTMPNGTLMEHYKNSGCDFTRSAGGEGTQEPPHPRYHNHIAVTKENLNGTRFLFMSHPKCIGVFEIKNDDIHFIGNNTSLSQFEMFQDNNRSELEIFEYEKVGQDEKYTLATSYFSAPDLINNDGGALHFFDVSINGTAVSFTNSYQVPIPKNSSITHDNQSVNGIEFSEDGLIVYASIAYYTINPVTFENDKNIIHCRRTGLGSNFFYFNVLQSGSATKDFGHGQIERGLDGKLYFAGDGRLGTLDDSNDPSSTFTPNAVTVNNNLTYGSQYIDPGFFTDKGAMHLYLLPDQIDGEDYSLWGSEELDLFPDVIYNCDFPYVLDLLGTYYISTVSLDPNDTTIYISGYGSQVFLDGPAIITIKTSENSSCEETVIIKCCAEPGTEMLCADPLEDSLNCLRPDPNDPFTWSLVVCGKTCTTDVPAACDVIWSFSYQDAGGTMQAVQFQGNTFCTTIPDNTYNYNNITLHLNKTFCMPEECGEGFEVFLQQAIPFDCPLSEY